MLKPDDYEGQWKLFGRKKEIYGHDISLEEYVEICRAAVALRDSENPDKDGVFEMDGKLRRVLGDIDPFWMRWSFFREQLGVEANLIEYYAELEQKRKELEEWK